MLRKIILVVGLGAAALFGACSKQPLPGDEYLGNWSDGSKAPIVIKRGDGGFDIQQTGDTDVMHGEYKDGAVQVTSQGRTLLFTYDKNVDAISLKAGSFTLGMLKRLK